MWVNQVLNCASGRASCASVGPVLTKRAHHGQHQVHQLGRSWPNLVPNHASRRACASAGAVVPKPASQPRTCRASCASVGPVLTKPCPKPRIMASIRCISWAVPGQTWFLTTHHGEHHVHQLEPWCPNKLLNRVHAEHHVHQLGQS